MNNQASDLALHITWETRNMLAGVTCEAVSDEGWWNCFVNKHCSWNSKIMQSIVLIIDPRLIITNDRNSLAEGYVLSLT